MAIEVFNRVEKKYMVARDEYEALHGRLMEHMKEDGYNNGGAYTISNLYYDTADNSLIRHSLSKPVYKEKLRIRGYGTPELDEEVYIEMKKKVRGVVNKRRSAITLAGAYEFLETRTPPPPEPYMNRQVLSEIAYLLSLYDLEPRLYLAYDRFGLFSADGHDLRITFDTNIRSRRYDLRMEAGDYGDPLLDEDFMLMEVKAGLSIPLWLSEILSGMKLFPISFSKYGTEYTRTLAQSSEEGANIIWTPYLTACSATRQTPLCQLKAQ